MTLTEARGLLAAGILLVIAGVAWLLGPLVLFISGAGLIAAALSAEVKGEPSASLANPNAQRRGGQRV
jgi:hypothetical protein